MKTKILYIVYGLAVVSVMVLTSCEKQEVKPVPHKKCDKQHPPIDSTTVMDASSGIST
ncbi:MAG: hypothetical protein K0S32_4212 [Bacteroidetes bacterium]|jgi:hypothetical protein|nr:hypothetical protein [Bacteroidota bacterium]